MRLHGICNLSVILSFIECLFDFTSSDISACDLRHNKEDCEQTGFTSWKTSVRSAAGSCDNVCSQATRDMFINIFKVTLHPSIGTSLLGDNGFAAKK